MLVRGLLTENWRGDPRSSGVGGLEGRETACLRRQQAGWRGWAASWTLENKREIRLKNGELESKGGENEGWKGTRAVKSVDFPS